MAPIVRGEKGEFRKEMMSARKQGFQRIKVNGNVHDLSDILPQLDKNKKHNIEIIVDRIVIAEDLGNRVADSVETALKIAEGLIYVEIVSVPEEPESDKSKSSKSKKNATNELVQSANNNELLNAKVGDVVLFSEKFSCPESGFTIAEIEPRLFSFNSPFGACRKCDGLGNERYFSTDLLVDDENLSLRQGAISMWQGVQERFYQQVLAAMAAHYKFSLDVPFKNLPNDIKNKIFMEQVMKKLKLKLMMVLNQSKLKKFLMALSIV